MKWKRGATAETANNVVLTSSHHLLLLLLFSSLTALYPLCFRAPVLLPTVPIIPQPSKLCWEK